MNIKSSKEKKMTTPQQFVTVYMQRGGDLDAISRDLGLNRASVYQRTQRMRKMGVRLPLQRKTKRTHISELNNLIKEYKNA